MLIYFCLNLEYAINQVSKQKPKVFVNSHFLAKIEMTNEHLATKSEIK